MGKADLTEAVVGWLGQSPHPNQRLVIRDLSRFRIVVAGRRWGKSLCASWEAFAAAMRRQRVWVVSATYEHADRVFAPCWTYAARKGGVEAGSSRAERKLVLPGGGFIHAKSADHPDSLVGEGLDFVVVDEAALLRPNVWFQMLRPSLSDRRGRALLISTPRGRNWLWQLFAAARQNNAGPGEREWSAWSAPSWSNVVTYPGGRADPEIVAAERAYDEAGLRPLFEQEYGASFTALSGRVYSRWDPQTHVADDKATRAAVRDIVVGVDFGYRNPTAVIVMGCTGDDNWRVLAEWYQRGKVWDEVLAACREIQAQWHGVRWWCDPSEPGQIAALQRAGIPARAADNDVSAGILAVAAVIGRPRGFLVARSCPNTIRELDGYVYRDDSATRQTEEPVKVDDHAADAIRYVIASERRYFATRPQSFRMDF